jgi:hypothetical protein
MIAPKPEYFIDLPNAILRWPRVISAFPALFVAENSFQ